jgi:SAM-dependent methyltransferase
MHCQWLVQRSCWPLEISIYEDVYLPGVQVMELSRSRRNDCPNCGETGRLTEFYEVSQIPVHSVILMDHREEALAYPKRDLTLACCERCGFIFNGVFDPTVHEYSARYEETQGYSEVFNAFADRLARDLINRHDLRGKRIIEIGCGKGEFLTHICELGENEGIGFDPAYVADRSRAKRTGRVSFIQDFYSEKYNNYQADFVCCKMTLEHINETGTFIRMLRDNLEPNPETLVFFQVPDVTRVLEERAFWDVYYEHCSYFNAESLRFLFETSGFEVLDLWNDYDGQYLMIEARPTFLTSNDSTYQREGENSVFALVDDFKNDVRRLRASWVDYLSAQASRSKTVVLWGGGSKAVAFLTTLQASAEVSCAVDINPNKHGTFLPGTGHRVVGPDSLVPISPDVVIPMNPVYFEEIREALEVRDLRPEIIPVTALPETVTQS